MTAVPLAPPRLVAFFLSLPEPIGISHSSTYSFSEDEQLLGIDPDPVFANPDQPPIPGVAANERFVSLKFWQVKSTMVDFAEQWNALAKVISVAVGSPWTNASSSLPAVTRTIVEAVTYLTPNNGHGVAAALDRCLRWTNVIVTSYGLATRSLVTPLSIQRMPDLVPYATRETTETEWSEVSLMLTGYSDLQRRVPPELDEDSHTAMISLVSAMRAENDPVLPYLELTAEARRAFDRDGDTKAAIIYAEAACEVLFDSVLESLLWEEGMMPEEAYSNFFPPNSALGARVRRNDAYRAVLVAAIGSWSERVQ